MGEPEVEPGGPPGTIASQCEHSGTADDINRDTDSPQSPNPTNEVAVSDAELGDKGTESSAGEVGTIAEKFTLDEEEEVGAMAGDDNPSVKEEEAEAKEVPTVEIGSSVEIGRLTETVALQEAVIAGTEEVLKEEDSQIVDHEAKREEGDDDQMEASTKEEVGPTVKTGSFSEAGAVGEAVVAGGDDVMPKEDEEVEQQVELMDETDEKEEDFTQTDEEAPHKDLEMVHSEDNNATQDEETNMDDARTHDDHGDDKAINEDLTHDVGGDKAMDEDLTQDGGGGKAMDEAAMGVDGDGMDDDGADDQSAKHGDEGMGVNDGEEDEEEDDPPTLPVKKSGGRKKRGRQPKIKKGEEELCFICFDGGELVVCDRRSDY